MWRNFGRTSPVDKAASVNYVFFFFFSVCPVRLCNQSDLKSHSESLLVECLAGAVSPRCRGE